MQHGSKKLTLSSPPVARTWPDRGPTATQFVLPAWATNSCALKPVNEPMLAEGSMVDLEVYARSRLGSDVHFSTKILHEVKMYSVRETQSLKSPCSAFQGNRAGGDEKSPHVSAWHPIDRRDYAAMVTGEGRRISRSLTICSIR